MDSTLSSALEVFDKTRFAFAPIVANRDNERDGEIGGTSSLVVTGSTDNKRYFSANCKKPIFLYQ